MNITFIIPAHNEELYVGDCIDSILQNASGRFSEIIVIDNASTDQTTEIAQDRQIVRVVREPNKGLTRARQRGLQEATGTLLAYIDADTRLPIAWIDKVEETFKRQPDIVCLSGPYRYYDGPWVAQKLLNAICSIILPIGYKLFGHLVVGGNFVARKSALEMIGGFDHTIGFYGEDVDIARRISSQGKVVFRRDFFLYTSGRRFYAEGLIKTNLRYLINFFWINLFHKPYSNTSTDVRSFH